MLSGCHVAYFVALFVVRIVASSLCFSRHPFTSKGLRGIKKGAGGSLFLQPRRSAYRIITTVRIDNYPLSETLNVGHGDVLPQVYLVQSVANVFATLLELCEARSLLSCSQKLHLNCR